jgi:putative oxidoreductase
VIPSARAVRTTAPITAFNPGQSPPPMVTPIVRVCSRIPDASPEATEDFTLSIARVAASLHVKVSTGSALEELFASDTILLLDSNDGLDPWARRGADMETLEKLKPLALLLLRAGLGVVFIFHGYPKLLTHTQEIMGAFGKMGFPGYFVYIAGVVEFFGGIVLILGLFTRIAALLLAGEMAIAVLRVHLPQGTIMDVKNYEFPMILALTCFALATLGAGLISLDHAIYRGGRPARRPKGRG